MCFADCISDHANYILMFMIKLIQHVKNSSLYIDACAHGNSAYLVVIQPQLHSKKCTTCSGLMKTGLNNVVLPTLFKVVNNTEQGDGDEPELACNQV